MKDGKRFASWIGRKARSGAERIGERVEVYRAERERSKEDERILRGQQNVAYEIGRTEGRLIGARQRGYKQGITEAQRPSGFARFAGTLGSMSKVLGETFQVDSSFYGVGPSRSPHKRTNKHRVGKKRGKRKGRTIVIKL